MVVFMKEIVNGLISEKIMGWSRKTLPNNDQSLPYYANFWVDDNGVKQCLVNFWSPVMDLKDAWVIIRKLREIGILITIEACTDGYKSFYNGTFGCFSESETIAISISSLKSVGVDMDDCYSRLSEYKK